MKKTVVLAITVLIQTPCLADTNIDYGLVETMHYWQGHDGLLIVHETQRTAQNCSRGDFYILPKSHTHYDEMLSLISSAFIEGKRARLRLIGCAENFPRITHIYAASDESPATGPTYTRREQAFTVNATSLRTTTAPCQAGETVVGGGYSVEDDPQLNVWENRPNTALTGWLVSVSNYGSANRNGRVHAICVTN